MTELPELPSGSNRALLALLHRLPQGALSRVFGRMADIPLPPGVRRPVLGAFARAVGADLSEAERPLEEYSSLNDFFTRRLRDGVRAIPTDDAVASSPVDGKTGQVGVVREGMALQAKGRAYSAGGLLGDAAEAEIFEGGAFLTLYLSPRDYHRIHTPCAGVISQARHVPGFLLPVNAPAVAHLPELFAKNERLVAYVDGPLGRVAIVAVGAYNVGRISAAFDPAWNAAPGESHWVTNRRGARVETKGYDPPVAVAQGEEIMTFHLGSTVVLFFEPGRVKLDPAIAPGRPVRLGEVLGRS